MDRRFVLIALSTVCMACRAQSAPGVPTSPEAEQAPLPDIRVTAPRASTSAASKQFSHVTVITADDIARSTAPDVSTLLAAQAGLSIQSYFGNDKKTSIDMRGMGATASSNVLILVDGERLNENDLSGADLSTVNLGQIERIEVIRGGGMVRYGQGAVGGVINIVTKRPDTGPLKMDFMAKAGSYDTRVLQATARGGSEQVAAQVMLSQAATDGYRDNGGLVSNTAIVELRRPSISDQGLVDLYARVTLHDDTYGMPGPVSAEAFNADDRSRRATNAPRDGGATSDHRLTIGGAYDWGAAGKMSLTLSHRERNDAYLIGAPPPSSALPLDGARGLIQSKRDNAQWRHDLSTQIGGLTQSMTIGLDAENASYARWNGGVAIDGSKLISGNVQSRAVFIDTNTSPLKGVNIHAGVRQDWFNTNETNTSYAQNCEFEFIGGTPRRTNCHLDATIDPNQTVAQSWSNPSAELGVSWTFAPQWTVFHSLSQHVRYPNLDELALKAEDLRPQHGRSAEVGIRNMASQWSWSLAAFVMRIDDEIYYGKNSQGFSENRNYEHPTLRQGLELETNWRPDPRWLLTGQWAYVTPKFENVPGNPDIPLVPRNVLSGQITWDALPDQQWTLQARHGSQRLDGNALDGGESSAIPIRANTVVDTAWRLHQNQWQLSLGINNLFDEVYANEAYSGTTYPMPGRQFYVEWRLTH